MTSLPIDISFVAKTSGKVTQEFAAAALQDGLAYPELLQRIVGLGMQRAMPGKSAS